MCAGAGGGTPTRAVLLLAAVSVVVMAGGVDLTEVRLRGGSLRIRRLGAVRNGGAANFGGTAVVEVLEAAVGGEGRAGAPGGEAFQGVGGAAGEKTGNEAGESKGGYFEDAAGGTGTLSGGHGDLQRQNVFKMQDFRRLQLGKVNSVGSGRQ